MFLIVPVFGNRLKDGRFSQKLQKLSIFPISLVSILVQLHGLYFLKTLMASIAVTSASHVGRTLRIP